MLIVSVDIGNVDANIDRLSLVGGDIDGLLRWNCLFGMVLSFLSCWMSLVGKAQQITLVSFYFYCNWLPKDSLSKAKPLLKREPHLSFWLLWLLFIFFLPNSDMTWGISSSHKCAFYIYFSSFCEDNIICFMANVLFLVF